MTFVYGAIAVIVGLIVAFFGLQFVQIAKMQRQKGKPAPELSGKVGNWVSTGKTALFYFYSPSCGACKTMTPIVKKLAKKRGGGVFPIDISRDMQTAQKFGVMATPTTIVVGKGIVAQILVGPQPASALEQLI
jgi:thioredoxin 1